MSRSSLLAVAAVGFLLAAARAADPDTPNKVKVPPRVAPLLELSADEVIKRLDKNKDGSLDKDELPPFLAARFDKFDTNGDGKLDRSEVEAMMKVLRRRFAQAAAPPDKDEVERLVALMLQRQDANGDGKISKDEARGKLAENFDRLDVNKDGFLDKDELRRAAAIYLAVQAASNTDGGPPAARAEMPDFDALDRDADGRLSREELKGTPLADHFDEIDANKDGKIDRKEFAAYFKKQAEKKSP